MKNQKQLKCFIACAFGRDDIDKIYFDSILPILNQFNIHPLRVDLINHNKNIDQKIVDLIGECDFCISDLTYSRPSVYYEAGFVHGLKKEVIFTVRNDHFIPKENDEFGITRIHFDLLTKNIIGWEISDSEFENKLKSRIQLIIKPILMKKLEVDEGLKKIYEFKSKSLEAQLMTIDNFGVQFLQKHKFKIVDDTLYYKSGYKVDNKRKKIIAIFTLEKMLSKKLNSFKFYTTIFNELAGVKSSDQSTVYLIFNVIRNVSVSTIQSCFPDLHRISDLKIFSSNYDNDNRKINYIFIDNIKSETDFLDKSKLIVIQ